MQVPALGAAFEVSGLDRGVVERLARIGSAEWRQLFAVYVLDEENAVREGQPALLGSYRLSEGKLLFLPRFSLEPGLSYRAVLHAALLPGSERADLPPVIAADFHLARSPSVATTAVEQIYPSAEELPENLLKFYLHFSSPMSQGRSYTYIHLLDADGQEIELPFLELEEELWDPKGRRFTLLFDPGRIKTGLTPRREVGPPLRQGQVFTLVIDREWPDAEGNPLAVGYRRKFQVGPPDHDSPDPSEWTIDPPRVETREPLTVRFHEPLDHALLQRLVWVADQDHTPLPGGIEVQAHETVWRFAPHDPWAPETYELRVDAALADLAGNSVGRPFEVSLPDGGSDAAPPPIVHRAFRPQEGN